MSFLGGLFQSFGRLLPGYMQGERQAVQDNWNDLNQYNKVQAGQLQNMFDENVMPDRMNMVKDNAMINNYQRHAAGLDLGYKYAQMPLAYWQLGQQTAWAPVMGQLRHQMLMQNPALMMGGLGGLGGLGGRQGDALQQAMFGGLPQAGLAGGYYGTGMRGRSPSALYG